MDFEKLTLFKTPHAQRYALTLYHDGKKSNIKQGS
jgi:hypothetical protein